MRVYFADQNIIFCKPELRNLLTKFCMKVVNIIYGHFILYSRHSSNGTEQLMKCTIKKAKTAESLLS